jgi:phosphopantothenoylcysteine decarboxylase/phosphopantothenate--cysteine ligase
VGFAAETQDVVVNAQAKLEAKGLDLIVANEAVATIGSSRSQATLIRRGRPPVQLEEADKDEVAARIMAEVADIAGRGSEDA